MVNNSTNINQQRKFKQWWSTIVEISTNKESLNSDGQQLWKYQQNKESLNSDGQQLWKYQPTKKV